MHTKKHAFINSACFFLLSLKKVKINLANYFLTTHKFDIYHRSVLSK